MTLAQQLSTIQTKLKSLVYKASNLPRVILEKKDYPQRIALLKQQEKELLKQVRDYELHGEQTDAESEYQQISDEEKAKTQKTLLIAGSVLGGLLLLGTTILIIKKRRKK